MQVALKRAFMTEHQQALQKTAVSVLLDLEKLSQRWPDSSYPPVHAALAMQVYCGRILEAEGEASKQIWTERGILAGGPQAPLAAKIYLQPALQSFHKKRPQLHTDLWIDDLSFGLVDRNPANAVRIALGAFGYITQLLEEDDVVISMKKTGFVVSDAKAKRLLKEQLTTLYNQQLEKDRQAAEEVNVDPDEISAEKLITIMANVGVHATAEQVKNFASKLSENAVKRRKCG